MRDLYKGMDDSLRFKNEIESENKESANIEEIKARYNEENNDDADVFKDFRGILCPMNFVKTKIALTPMKKGEILNIYLDDGQPIENVPRSVQSEGHIIIA